MLHPNLWSSRKREQAAVPSSGPWAENLTCPHETHQPSPESFLHHTFRSLTISLIPGSTKGSPRVNCGLLYWWLCHISPLFFTKDQVIKQNGGQGISKSD